MSDQVELAKTIARRQHAGQVDTSGRDYFEVHLTPIAELLRPYGLRAEALGWLHDVIEDTGTTVKELIAEGVDPEVADAVSAVSRIPGETYSSLIARSASNQLSALGKLADNAWNVACNPYLALTEPEKAASMLKGRYLPARPQLIAGSGLSDDEAEQMLEQARVIAARLNA